MDPNRVIPKDSDTAGASPTISESHRQECVKTVFFPGFPRRWGGGGVRPRLSDLQTQQTPACQDRPEARARRRRGQALGAVGRAAQKCSEDPEGPHEVSQVFLRTEQVSFREQGPETPPRAQSLCRREGPLSARGRAICRLKKMSLPSHPTYEAKAY